MIDLEINMEPLLEQENCAVLCMFDARRRPDPSLLEALRLHPQILLDGPEPRANPLFMADRRLERERAPVPVSKLLLELLRNPGLDNAEASRTLGEIRRGQTVMNRALRASKLGVWDWRPDSDSVVWSDGLAEIFGLAPSDRARPTSEFFNLIHPSDLAHLHAEIQAAARGKDYFEVEFRITRPDGKERMLRTIAQVERDELGGVVRWVGATQDVTDSWIHARRVAVDQADFQRQKLESLGVLAGGVAHDFNNLLTAVLGHAELAMLDMTEGPVHDSLAQIHQAAAKAAELTQQMLAYAGQGRFVSRRIDLAAMLHDMAPLLSASKSRKIDLEMQLDGPLPRVAGDVNQLRQAVLNLATNAAEAIGEAEGTIAIELDRVRLEAPLDASCFVLTDDPPVGDCLRLRVRDSGPGMDARCRARAFEPFFTTRFIGRGLGLPVVLGVVRTHGGTVCLQSAPGEGTCVDIFLPALDELQIDDDDNRPRGRFHGRVLVVDDEPLVRNTATALLEALGLDVTAASDGVDAVDLYRAEPDAYDLVLLDLAMPRMNGVETIERIRAIDPEAKILLCSGYDRIQAERRFDELPVEGFLEKPFTIDDLARAIAALAEAD